MNKIVISLFEALLGKFEELAQKTETKADDAIVAGIRAAFEAYKKLG